MSVILWHPWPGIEKMLNALRRELPDTVVRDWNDQGDKSDVNYAVVWNPPKGELKTFPNLKCVFSMFAGIEHMMQDPELPDVPISHLIDNALTQGMTEYVVHNVLLHHRRRREFDEQQKQKLWKGLSIPPASARHVGIMGFGALGSDAARALLALDFNIAAWSRTPKSMAGVTSFHGSEGLSAFLAQTEILVCLLPLTPATTGILNHDFFSKLPKGAYLINAGRGGSQVEEDILSALFSGQLAGVSLDVFETEPLPNEHPFWDHPKVIITPHNASRTDTDSSARTIAANIIRFEAGKSVHGLVDRTRGY
jgi:glyoxylate/hydroxypyruvate reductase A